MYTSWATFCNFKFMAMILSFTPEMRMSRVFCYFLIGISNHCMMLIQIYEIVYAVEIIKRERRLINVFKFYICLYRFGDVIGNYISWYLLSYAENIWVIYFWILIWTIHSWMLTWNISLFVNADGLMKRLLQGNENKS